MNKDLKVKIYGDSIMRATVIDDNNRYHAMISGLLEWLAGVFRLDFCNRSRFGITVDKGMKMLDKDLQKGLDCDYAVFEFGGNDCSFAWEEVARRPADEHLPFTDIEVYKNTLGTMVEKAAAAGATPVLVTLPPIDAGRHLEYIGKTEDERRNILQWLGDVQTIYRFHEMYSKAVERIAACTGAILVDVRGRFLPKHNLRELVGHDGVHLTQRGYQLYARVFADFIKAHRQNPQRLVFE